MLYLFFFWQYVVNNFQSLTAELVRKKESKGKNVELARLKKQFSAELSRHHEMLQEARFYVIFSIVSPRTLYYNGVIC